MKKKGGFCFVRNPWERIVSLYFLRMVRVRRFRKKPLPFEKWLKADEQIALCYPQHLYWQNADDIFQFENLEPVLMTMFDVTEIPKKNASNQNGRTNRHLLKELREKHWSDFYTPTTKALVTEWELPTIERFGFIYKERNELQRQAPVQPT